MTAAKYRPPRRRRARTRAAVVASSAGVAVAALLMWFVVDYAHHQPEKVHLGQDTFVVGKATRLAKRISEQREPFLFKDPLTSKAGREVYVQHLGRDPKKGWLAIGAYAPGSPHELRCILRWDADASVFRDPCSGRGEEDGGTFPADGDGLRTYPAKVLANGEVEVDLKGVTNVTRTTS